MKTTAKALLFAALTLIFTACSSKKSSLTYFEDLKATDGVVDVQPYTPVIQPDDELFISVSSTIPAATAAYMRTVTSTPTTDVPPRTVQVVWPTSGPSLATRAFLHLLENQTPKTPQ